MIGVDAQLGKQCDFFRLRLGRFRDSAIIQAYLVVTWFLEKLIGTGQFVLAGASNPSCPGSVHYLVGWLGLVASIPAPRASVLFILLRLKILIFIWFVMTYSGVDGMTTTTESCMYNTVYLPERGLVYCICMHVCTCTYILTYNFSDIHFSNAPSWIRVTSVNAWCTILTSYVLVSAYTTYVSVFMLLCMHVRS